MLFIKAVVVIVIALIMLINPQLVYERQGTALGVMSHGAPEYAKWGRLAMKETARKYDATIIDYKHLGRSRKNAEESVESFQLWVRSSGKEFAVLVEISFLTETEEFKRIEFKEKRS